MESSHGENTCDTYNKNIYKAISQSKCISDPMCIWDGNDQKCYITSDDSYINTTDNSFLWPTFNSGRQVSIRTWNDFNEFLSNNRFAKNIKVGENEHLFIFEWVFLNTSSDFFVSFANYCANVLCNRKLSESYLKVDTTKRNPFKLRFCIIYTESKSLSSLNDIQAVAFVTPANLYMANFYSKYKKDKSATYNEKVIYVDAICSNVKKASKILNYLENESYFDIIALSAITSAYTYYIKRGYLRSCNLNENIYPFYRDQNNADDENQKALVNSINKKIQQCSSELFGCERLLGDYCLNDSEDNGFMMMKKIPKKQAGGRNNKNGEVKHIKVKTGEYFTYKSHKYVLYTGSRGARYIKLRGKYKSIRKL